MFLPRIPAFSDLLATDNALSPSDPLAPVLPRAGKSALAPAPGGPLIARASESGDAADNTGTTASVSVGDTFDGTIGSSSDRDWVAVTLEAGQSYVFSVWGTGGASAGVDDTILVLHDSAGNQLAINDDAATGNLFSLISYSATTSGTYYLDVAGYGGEQGSYRLQAATNVYTVDQVASFLADFYFSSPARIHHGVSPGGTITVNLTALTADGQQLARWALEAWSDATGLNFSEVSSGGDIRFDDNQAGAFAGPAGFDPDTGVITYSEVNIGTAWLTSYGTTLDSYSMESYIHEIGHALGLGHAGLYDGSASYPTDAVYLNDSRQMTVMSYFDPDENTFVNGSYASPVTPMVADVTAMELLYGLYTGSHTGDTTWGANSNVGGYLGTLFGYIFDGVTPDPALYAGGPVSFTIVDDGGTDTLDLSTATVDQNINLNGGTVSDINGLTGNMVIAQNTVIEHAIGGSGADTILGNGANNRLTGNAGNDTLDGADGYDTLIGGAGNDTLTGGTSSSDLRDVIYGGDGNDIIDGGYGNDELRGDAGDDTIAGGYGVDKVIGGAGNDTLTGAAWSDEIFGGDGIDFINGGYGYDRVNGGAGADRFYHAGVAGHGSDWIQDYDAAEGDVLLWGGAAGVSKSDFQVNIAHTDSAGSDAVDEAFVIYKPTGQILWALVDGGGQGSITLRIDGTDYDLLA